MPADLKELFEQALECEDRGDFHGAREIWEQIVAADPAHGSAAYNHGVCLFRLGDLDAAIDAFTKALAVDPRDAGAFYNRGVAWRKKADQVGFVAAVGDTMKAVSEPAMTFIQQAIADYTEAINIDARRWHYMNRATCHRVLGDDEKAIADAKQAAAMGDDNARRFLRAEFQVDWDG